MDVPKADRELTASDTVIMERPGLWELTRSDDEVGYEGSAATEARPAIPPSPQKSR